MIWWRIMPKFFNFFFSNFWTDFPEFVCSTTDNSPCQQRACLCDVEMVNQVWVIFEISSKFGFFQISSFLTKFFSIQELTFPSVLSDLKSWNPLNSLQNGFSFVEKCPPKPNHGLYPSPLECCGDYPHRFPFKVRFKLKLSKRISITLIAKTVYKKNQSHIL